MWSSHQLHSVGYQSALPHFSYSLFLYHANIHIIQLFNNPWPFRQPHFFVFRIVCVRYTRDWDVNSRCIRCVREGHIKLFCHPWRIDSLEKFKCFALRLEEGCRVRVKVSCVFGDEDSDTNYCNIIVVNRVSKYNWRAMMSYGCKCCRNHNKIDGTIRRTDKKRCWNALKSSIWPGNCVRLNVRFLILIKKLFNIIFCPTRA